MSLRASLDEVRINFRRRIWDEAELNELSTGDMQLLLSIGTTSDRVRWLAAMKAKQAAKLAKGDCEFMVAELLNDISEEKRLEIASKLSPDDQKRVLRTLLSLEHFQTRYYTKNSDYYQPEMRVANDKVPYNLAPWMSVVECSKCGEPFESFQTQMSAACRLHTWHWSCRKGGGCPVEGCKGL